MMTMCVLTLYSQHVERTGDGLQCVAISCCSVEHGVVVHVIPSVEQHQLITGSDVMTVTGACQHAPTRVQPVYIGRRVAVHWRQIKDNSVTFKHVSVCVCAAVTERCNVYNTVIALCTVNDTTVACVT